MCEYFFPVNFAEFEPVSKDFSTYDMLRAIWGYPQLADSTAQSDDPHKGSQPADSYANQWIADPTKALGSRSRHSVAAVGIPVSTVECHLSGLQLTEHVG